MKPLGNSFGIQAAGFAFQKYSQDDLAEILLLVEHVGLVVFRHQSLADADLYDLARRIGPLKAPARTFNLAPGCPEIGYRSDLRSERGEPPRSPGDTINHWHSDQQHRMHPATLAFIYCVRSAASGGAMSFVSTDVTKAGLDESMVADLAALRAIYEPAGGRDDVSPNQVAHPALLTSPSSDAQYAYVSESTLRFKGLDDEASAKLKARVLRRLLRPERLYSHRWEAGDFVLYDNAQLLHRSEPSRARPRLKAANIYAPNEVFAVPEGKAVDPHTPTIPTHSGDRAVVRRRATLTQELGTYLAWAEQRTGCTPHRRRAG
jgi:taurine dioxygenase